MILDIFELVQGIESIVPWWLEAIAAVYLVIAFILGCPFCAMPNLGWPLDLIRDVRDSDYDRDIVTEHRRLPDDA